MFWCAYIQSHLGCLYSLALWAFLINIFLLSQLDTNKQTTGDGSHPSVQIHAHIPATQLTSPSLWDGQCVKEKKRSPCLKGRQELMGPTLRNKNTHILQYRAFS